MCRSGRNSWLRCGVTPRNILLPWCGGPRAGVNCGPEYPRDATLFLLDAVFDRFLQAVAVPALDVTLGLHQATDAAIHKHIRELISLLQDGLMA